MNGKVILFVFLTLLWLKYSRDFMNTDLDHNPKRILTWLEDRVQFWSFQKHELVHLAIYSATSWYNVNVVEIVIISPECIVLFSPPQWFSFDVLQELEPSTWRNHWFLHSTYIETHYMYWFINVIMTGYEVHIKLNTAECWTQR